LDESYAMKLRNLTFTLLLLLAASFSWAAKTGINQDAIQKAYSDSDWDLVKNQLEGYLKKHGDANVSKEERIFAYKYLGVICAADSVTQARAESYFHRLLDLSPEIDIVDMYASKRVGELFRTVKNEHQGRIDYQQKHDKYGQVVVAPNSQPTSLSDSMPAPRHRETMPLPAKASPKNAKSHAWLWWTTGTAVTAGAIAGIYVLSSQSSEVKTVTQTDEINGKLPGTKP
jgi:hypothetical protein